MRWWRHLCPPSACRYFPDAALVRIADAIAAGEQGHGGQLVFAVEEGLGWSDVWRGLTARERAEHTFSALRVWDTAGNNGVLLYLLLADHAVEVVVDRAYDGRIDESYWQQVCTNLRERARAGMSLALAVEAAIVDASSLMAVAVPAPPPTEPRERGVSNQPRFL